MTVPTTERADTPFQLRCDLNWAIGYATTAVIDEWREPLVEMLTSIAERTNRLVADIDAAERGNLGPVPTEEGGPGHEEAYWLRLKLKASIRHLRDIEDYYRTQGGLLESPNMRRADRARAIYEQISDDYLNGSSTRPTMRERAEQAEARLVAVEDALREISECVLKGWTNPAFVRGRLHERAVEIARASLAAAGEDA